MEMRSCAGRMEPHRVVRPDSLFRSVHERRNGGQAGWYYGIKAADMRLEFVRAVALSVLFLPVTLIAQRASEVDPMLGADGGGNVFIGPTLPFGMAKPGPDYGLNEANSGWQATGNLNGFSQLHVSGTGGGGKYGNISVQPMMGK